MIREAPARVSGGGTGAGRRGKADGRSATGVRSGRGVNDFALKIATVNGTGSASANGLIMKSIFRMGAPVSGKNVFPSNIQGLPTWYEIRINAQGHVARTPGFDVLVAMNGETYERDIAEVAEGGWLLYDSSWPLARELRREDVTHIGVPLAEMCVKRFEGSRIRILMKNIAYAGALAALLDIDLDVIRGLLEETFGARKRHLLEANNTAIDLGHNYVTERYDCPLPIRVARPAGDELSWEGRILMDGNTAAALGCIYAGATVASWYPITPSTSLVDAFGKFAGTMRKDPDSGRMRAAIIQAEDELAAAGMTVGAGWAGARAFTATSGPGISLMSEFVGLAYYAEVPSVFFDIQRVGPSTGMPTRTQQCDLLLCAYASHGDTRHICLYPGDPAECFDFAVRAFDVADRFQTPVFVVSDLDVGMNDWAVPPLQWDPACGPDRGKIKSAEELDRMDRFFRYLDVDGDGIAWRTIPGEHPLGAHLTRGSGHTKYGTYTEDAEGYTEVVDRISEKIESSAPVLPEPVMELVPGAEMALVTVGGCEGAVREAMDRLGNSGLHFNYMRVRGFPFAESVREFLAEQKRVFVVEQNRDGQLRSLLTTETGVAGASLEPVLYYGGLPMSAVHVVDGVLARLEAGPAGSPAPARTGAAA